MAGVLLGEPCTAGAETAPDSLDSTAASQVVKPIETRPGLYSLGKVTVDARRRQVSFPAQVNQRDGVVEYAIVTSRGKTHESVFRTDAQPQNIHVAMLLLGAKPAHTNFFPADLSLPLPGERVLIHVAWQESGRRVSRPLEVFILTTNNMRSMAAGPWAYNGSYIVDGTFVAQRDGSIVSIQIDPNALVNNPRRGRENDELHHVNPQALPPEDAPVKILMRLQTEGSTVVHTNIFETNTCATQP